MPASHRSASHMPAGTSRWSCPQSPGAGVQSLPGLRLQPVACELLVKGGLSVSRLIAVCRPEAGAVRCQHLVANHHVAVLIQTELKLCVRNDDAASQVRIPRISYREQSCSREEPSPHTSLPLPGIIFFQMSNTLLKGNVFVVISDLRLGGRCIDRLRQLVRFLQPLRQAECRRPSRSPCSWPSRCL